MIAGPLDLGSAFMFRAASSALCAGEYLWNRTRTHPGHQQPPRFGHPMKASRWSHTCATTGNDSGDTLARISSIHSIWSTPRWISRTPCRSAVWEPPSRRHDSTSTSLRRPHQRCNGLVMPGGTHETIRWKSWSGRRSQPHSLGGAEKGNPGGEAHRQSPAWRGEQGRGPQRRVNVRTRPRDEETPGAELAK